MNIFDFKNKVHGYLERMGLRIENHGDQRYQQISGPTSLFESDVAKQHAWHQARKRQSSARPPIPTNTASLGG
jgi:hypothetical protein